MPIREVRVPALIRTLSSIMGAPSSGSPETHESGLDAYRRLGGNCLHLHGEGGETHSRRAAGEWMRDRKLRSELFVCTQICHDGWDQDANRSIDRFTPEAVREDVATDLELVGGDSLDMVYLDDRPERDIEPVLEALNAEITAGRVRSIGVRNWTADRVRAVDSYTRDAGMPGIAALITTEMALPRADRPLWPEYLPFDRNMEHVVLELGLTVFAHAGDLTLGQCLFGNADAMANWRPDWVDRWDPAANAKLVQCTHEIAYTRGVSTRTVGIAWLLNQPYPVIAICSLPTLLGERAMEIEAATHMRFSDAESRSLNDARQTAQDYDL